MAEGYLKRDTILKMMHQYDGQHLYEALLYTEDADVRENVHGEWIPKERTAECSIDIDIICSRCGFVGCECYAYGYELNEIDMKKVRDHIKELDMNYCPCCGCSMDKGGE